VSDPALRRTLVHPAGLDRCGSCVRPMQIRQNLRPYLSCSKPRTARAHNSLTRAPRGPIAAQLRLPAVAIRDRLGFGTMEIMSPTLLVSGAGLVAGAMNALAGGGSFVSLPAMIAAGVPPVQANASSTVALFPGGVASVWAYRESLGPVGNVPLRNLFVTTLCGGAIGAALLLWTPATTFDFVIPWLLLLATLALGLGRRLGELLRRHTRIGIPTVLVIQFCLGVYGGYFGGAVGIMMMAVWNLLESRDLKSLHAPRTLLVTSANTAAVVTFVAARAVHWRETIVMLVAATLGGYLGAQIGRHAPSRLIRVATLALTACITLAFFARAYH
jgi:uncharacterized protein